MGVRTSWLDNRLTFNTVGYYIDWSDIQLSAWDIEAFAQKIQNVGKAEIWGLETEIRYQATENLHLSANYSYIDASLAEDYIDASTTPATVLAADGTRLPGSSKHALSLFADWQSSLTAGLDLIINANYRYVSSRPNNLGVAPGLTAALPGDLPSSEIVNLSAGVRHDNGVTVSLFANNLLDVRDLQTQLSLGSVWQGDVMNRPRTIGLKVGYQF